MKTNKDSKGLPKDHQISPPDILNASAEEIRSSIEAYLKRELVFGPSTISRDVSRGYYNGGVDYTQEAQYENALEAFGKATEVDRFSPTGVDAILAKGFLLLKMGRIEEGLTSLSHYVAVEPDNNRQQLVQEYLQEQVHIEDKLALMNQYFTVPPYLRKDMMHKGGIDSVNANVGLILTEAQNAIVNNDYTKAALSLYAAEQMDATNPTLWLLKGLLGIRNDNPAKAKSHFETCLRFAPQSLVREMLRSYLAQYDAVEDKIKLFHQIIELNQFTLENNQSMQNVEKTYSKANLIQPKSRTISESKPKPKSIDILPESTKKISDFDKMIDDITEEYNRKYDPDYIYHPNKDIKCSDCNLELDFKGYYCPSCGQYCGKGIPVDTETCAHVIINNFDFCSLCGEFTS